MNREDYQQVKQIFQSVLDIVPDNRADYLNEKCSDNIALRREVEKLLSSYESGYLEQPAIEKVAEFMVGNQLEVGQEIGHYCIIKKIGAGGMGEVYLAEDTKLDRQVAIKILSQEFAEDNDRMRRFVREAKSASALNHPNIITIHEIGETDGAHFITTEHIEGENLRERLNGEKLSMKSVFEVSIQIASALEAAHSAGIIHRDIKPENVMIRPDGLVKVLDFGLAKRAPQTGESAAKILLSYGTEPGKMIGTVTYMSPEQLQGKTVDGRTDLWSFGIVLSEMLTGDQPFGGESKVDKIAMILMDDPPPMDKSIPEKLQWIVTKCLAKKTDARYQTAQDLLTDLKDAKHDLEFHDKLERVPDQVANKTQSLPATPTNENQNQSTASAGYIVTQVKHHKFIYLTIAVLLFAAIGFGIYRYSGSQPINTSFDSVKITKVTNSGKVGENVALSRDGKWLVYSIRDGDKASLWIKQVAIPESNTQIVPPAAVNYRAFTFSPDGNNLYYSVEGEPMSNCTLYQMPFLGGTARKLLSGINGGISFSPDGKQITYGVEDLENDESILMVANADGSEPRELVKLKGNDEIGSSRGRWSPDGKSIAVFVGTNNPMTRQLATVSIATGEITRLETHKFSEFGHWEWLPDGKGFIVLARERREQNNSFWQISFPSQEAQRITNDLNSYSSMSLAADANILATVQNAMTMNIWLVPVADPARATPVTSGSIMNTGPQWTPDGKLVYIRGLGGNSDIYIVNTRGGSPKQLTSNNLNGHPRVSSDGRYIVYVSYQGGTPSIWRMDIDGGNPKQLTTEFSNFPSISPDGREVIYQVGVDTSRIWKVGIDGGQPVQLTDKESRNPVFSPDGKQFACRWWDDPNSEPKMAIIPSTGGKPVKTLAENGQGFRWMPDGRSFVYLVRKDGVSNIWLQPIDGGTPKQLTNFTSDDVWGFEFSPDGKQIAVSRGTETRDVVLITGFRK